MKIKSFFLSSLFLFMLVIQNFSFAQTAWYTQTINNTGDFRRMQFVNSLTGYASGGGGTLVKTTNGGYNWTKMTTGTTAFLSSLYFINANTGFISGKEPFVRKTTDGGVTWTAVDIDIRTTYEVYQIQFVNDLTGYASSVTRFHKTTDAGATWNTILENASLVLGSFQFINEYTGFALQGHTLKRTYNGGANWWDAPCNYTGGADYQCAYFFNDMTGWMAGAFQMRKTTDGGVTVGPVIPTEIETPYDVRFINENTGWCVGKHNYHTSIISTTSDATNWMNRLMVDHQAYYCVNYIDANKVFVGGNSRIISSINTVTSVQTISNQIPDGFSLRQNYPNPFNPETKINFDLQSSAFTSLKVYDSMGKEVKTLVSENLAVGSYSLNFNAENLTTGIYFYTLSSGDFKETKKMLLVK